MREKKKEPSLKKNHLIRNPQSERILPPGCLQGSVAVLPSPLGFACGLCLLLISRHAEASNIKTPVDMTPLNLDLLTTGDD